MINITKEDLESELKGISLRFPEQLHNNLKAVAAKNGMSKDKLFLEIVKTGCKHILVNE
jgi:hypothetical protein